MQHRILVLRELVGIPGGPEEEQSYQANLEECLSAKGRALADGDLLAAGHAARGSAESYRRLGAIAKAADEYALAVRLFRAAGNGRGLAWTLFANGNLLRQRSEFAAARATLAEALALARPSRDLGLVAYVMAGVAETTRILGDFPRAYREHIAAWRLFKALDDVRGTIWALEGVGQILRHAGSTSTALRHFSRAKQLATACNDARGLAYALKCRAECLADLGQPDAALDEARLAVKLFERIGLKVGLGYAYKALGDILRSAGHQSTALSGYLLAADIFLALSDARGFAYALNGVARLQLATGEHENATALFSYASSYFESTGIKLGARQSVNSLRRVQGAGLLSRQRFRDVVHAARSGQLRLTLPGPSSAPLGNGPAVYPRSALAGSLLLASASTGREA